MFACAAVPCIAGLFDGVERVAEEVVHDRCMHLQGNYHLSGFEVGLTSHKWGTFPYRGEVSGRKVTEAGVCTVI